VPMGLALIGLNGVVLWADLAPIWLTIGNVAILFVLAGVVAMSKQPVTGRQRRLRVVQEAS